MGQSGRLQCNNPVNQVNKIGIPKGAIYKKYIESNPKMDLT